MKHLVRGCIPAPIRNGRNPTYTKDGHMRLILAAAGYDIEGLATQFDCNNLFAELNVAQLFRRPSQIIAKFAPANMLQPTDDRL